MERHPEDGSRVNVPLLLAPIVVCVGLVLLASPLGGIASDFMPWRGQVKSAGTFFPNFADAAPGILRRSGVLAIAAIAGAVGARYASNWLAAKGSTNLDKLGALAVPVVVGATAAWIAWLATPHNGFPSNARIHWVDFLTVDSDDYFYAAGRLPHMLFYDAPTLWQVINACVLVALCVAIGRRLGFSWLVASLFGGVIATAGNFLRFANTAEDVFINLALAFLVLLVSLHRKPVLFGVALVLLALGRPQFMLIYPSVLLAEVVLSARQRRLPSATQIRYVAVTGATVLVGIVATQALFTVLGRRNFVVNGRLLDTPQWVDLQPQEIEGWLISSFSGTYVFHLLWTLPLATLVLATISAVRAPRLPADHEVTVYFAGLSFVTMVVLHEADPILYFNIRYLTYLLPFLLVMSWSAAATFTSGDAGWVFAGLVPVRTLLILLAVLGPMTIAGGAVESKRKLAGIPEVELVQIDDELRELADGRPVYLTPQGRGSRNYLSYVLRRGFETIQPIDVDQSIDNGVVVSRRGSPWIAGGSPVLETSKMMVFDVAGAG